MTQKSIKKNFAYNTILRILNIIFPIITFPYVARVLSPEGIGKVDFSLSIIQYFVLIANLGIPTYAVRECAKIRDDKDKLTQTFQEIFGINMLALVLSYILFTFVILNVNQLNSYRKILIIASFNILTTSIGMEWFYQAIEEYKYITIRSIFVKLISLVAIFLFVRDENDIIIYALITVLSTSLGYIYNFIHVRKYIYFFKRYRHYNFKRHLKPILLLFAMNLSVSIYVNLDKVMLGFLADDTAVGLYTAANKMVKVILALVTSLGVVLLPRMSYYIENNEDILVKRLINKSFNFILMISIPATIGIFMLAEAIILLYAGPNYIEAIPTIRIISPIIIAIGLSNLIGIQILTSYGKEKITLVSTLIGAIINFTLNLLLIPSMQQNGAAIGTIVAESSVTIIQLIFAHSYLKGNVKWKTICSYLFGGALIVLVTSTLKYLIANILLFTFLSVMLSIFAYFGFLYIIKNEMVYEMINKSLVLIKRMFANYFNRRRKNG